MCLKRLNYDRKELERRREESAHQNKGDGTLSSNIMPLMWDSLTSFTSQSLMSDRCFPQS